MISGLRSHRLPVLVVAVAMLGTMAALPAQASSAPRVSGVVTGAGGSAPIAGVKVCAEGSESRCTTSAEDGTYSIKLRVGPVRYHAYTGDVPGNWVEQLHNDGQIYHIKSTTVHHVNFALQPGATISGHLHAPDGGNPNDTFLGVAAYTVDAKGKTHGYANLLSNTGADGYFQINKMPAGTYKLLVTDHDTPQIYGQQWYPAASMASGGTPITVATGQDIADQDMTLSTPGSLSIQSLFGSHSAQSQMTLHDADGRRIGLGDTDSHGRVRFPALRPGSYKVEALARGAESYVEWYSHKRSFTTANPINVTSGVATEKTLTFHYVTLKNTSKPTLKVGDADVTASKGTWSPAASHHHYDWLRDGKVIIRGSDSWEYVLSKADVGHRIKVCVTGGHSGYASSRACSSYSRTIRTY